jgi:hypothetical protein
MADDGKARQKIQGSQIGGKIDQDVDVSDARQSVRESSAKSVRQRARTKPSTLEVFGKYRATGFAAIAAVVVIIIVTLAFRLLMS